MQVTQKTNTVLHQKLPIDADEEILAVYKHHWFAYAVNWIIGVIVVTIIMTLAYILTSIGGADSTIVTYRSQILAVAAVFSVLILAGTFVPVYLRMQEQVVLTDEAVLQLLRPSLFANKIDQLSLRHISDVSVQQDFLGTIFGYGHITIETPGEQNNYHFSTLNNPQVSAREIIAAHENFDAALHAGRMPTTLGEPVAQAPAIDPEQYRQFLQYQQMVAQQQQDQTAGTATNAQDQTTPGTPAEDTEPRQQR